MTCEIALLTLHRQVCYFHFNEDLQREATQHRITDHRLQNHDGLGFNFSVLTFPSFDLEQVTNLSNLSFLICVTGLH